MLPWPQSSSGLEARTSGFLSRTDMKLNSFNKEGRTRLMWRHESPLSWLFLSYGGTLSVLLEWSCVCQGTSSVASRVSRSLSRLERKIGIFLETLQQKRASSHMEGRISWLFSSCGRKLVVPLKL